MKPFLKATQNLDINMAEIRRKAREKQPGLIVVDREVPGVFQNYLTPEQHIPAEGLPYPLETCITMANTGATRPTMCIKPPTTWWRSWWIL